MFIRVWSKFENVGREDCGMPEHYVAIRYITRFYSRKYERDTVVRYLVVTGTENFYVEEKTFEYLKSLRNRNVFEKVPVSYK